MKHFRAPYTPTAPLIARVPFRFNGVSFMPGEAFPGEKVDPEAVTERRRRQMYDCRQVEVGETSDAADPAQNGEGKSPAPVAVYTTSYKGFGKYSLIAPDGSVVEEGLKKDEAQAKANALDKPAGEREARSQGTAASAPLAPVSGPTTPTVA